MMRKKTNLLYKGAKRSRLAVLLMMAGMLLSCNKDEVSQIYSTANYVYCYFDVLNYNQLFNTMGNPGQFATIDKQLVNGVQCFVMKSSVGSTNYQMDAMQLRFGLGLGGLIVGTNTFCENLAYDLSCPNCNKKEYRMKVTEDGHSKCSNCKIEYDLNNYGAIYSVGSGDRFTTPRGLYRYRIEYVGTTLTIHN